LFGDTIGCCGVPALRVSPTFDDRKVPAAVIGRAAKPPEETLAAYCILHVINPEYHQFPIFDLEAHEKQG
jgi:hypothetical protein